MTLNVRYAALAAIIFGCWIGCSDSTPEGTGNTTSRLTCTTTSDCAPIGGACVAGECHADNECDVDADCAAGETCVPDPGFGGLCTAPGQPPAPQPAWSCTHGVDCPALQGCGSDGLCHVDGECHNTIVNGNVVGDCADPEQICAASGDDPLTGFCTSERSGNLTDPFCRSTGTGQCRNQCTTNANCGGSGTCTNGFCYGDDECATDADCSLNHVCQTPPDWIYGYDLCFPADNPTCVPDGMGACRLACATDSDCIHGGGCESDGLCHASNECATNADCGPGLLCFPDPEFGGLCGPDHDI